MASAPAAFNLSVVPNPLAPSSAGDEGRASRADIQQAQDAFEHYWIGQYHWWREENHAGRRRAYYTRLRVPKYRPPRLRAEHPDAPPLRVDSQRYRWRQSTRQDTENLQQYIADVQKGGYQIMNYMRPLGFRLLKILGKGGFGMACLFEMTDVNGDKHKIVVKAGTGSDLYRERICLRVGGQLSHTRRFKADGLFLTSAWQEQGISFNSKRYEGYLNLKASSQLRPGC